MEHLHQQCKVDIRPEANFTSGLEFEIHSRWGTDYDTEVSNMSKENKSAAIVFGLRFNLTDPSVGPAAVVTLNQLLEMADSIDQVKQAKEEGSSVSFRHEGSNLYVNVEVTEQTAKNVIPIPLWNKLDLSKTVFSGRSDLKVSSGFDLTQLPTAQLEDIFEMLSNFKVEGNGNFDELHHVLDALKLVVAGPFKMLWEVVNVLKVVVSWGLEFRYDASIIKKVALELLELDLATRFPPEYQFTSAFIVKRIQSFSKGILEGGKEFAQQNLKFWAPKFLPFVELLNVELLKGLNLGYFHVFLMVPRVRVHLESGFNFLTLNTFLNTHFLSS